MSLGIFVGCHKRMLGRWLSFIRWIASGVRSAKRSGRNGGCCLFAHQLPAHANHCRGRTATARELHHGDTEKSPSRIPGGLERILESGFAGGRREGLSSDSAKHCLESSARLEHFQSEFAHPDYSPRIMRMKRILNGDCITSLFPARTTSCLSSPGSGSWLDSLHSPNSR
jgi:hypothetical protein